MSPVTVGLIGIGVLLVMFMLRMPIAFAMAFVGFLGYCYLSSPEGGLKILIQDIFGQFSSYSLTVIPAFVLMGTYAFASGISSRIYSMTYAWFGQLRGGLTIATVVACAAFGAICGSTSATVATVGKITLPEMRRYNYDDVLSTGTLASSATLSILIPPSTILIVYGVLTEQSIGALFISGILPGLILTVLLSLTVLFVCLRRPALAPASAVEVSFKDKLKSLSGGIEALILFGLALGGLFAGWFTPTQAGGVGAAGVLVIGLARRGLGWQQFVQANMSGLRTSCMVLFLITGAIIFGHFMAISRIPFVLVDRISGLAVSPVVIMIFIVLFYFVGGCFMDALALVTLTIPFLYPLVLELGFNPIWFGVIIVLITEVGVITPPVGVNVYVIKGIAPEIPLETIFKGISPFLLPIIATIAILMAFPQIATFLPGLMKW